ncbi:MAG: Alanine-tRNA ligase [Parcubacteria group bacterium GW2011_GWA2_47_7]|nr:MAG: Alanine-tRNA ligase [Parcubacteria group bacterium GW2011_GWA2_47_7]
MLTSTEIRSRFLEFFRKRGHAIIPSAPLVPLNDPSVLFNTAGMQPLVPYLLGEQHPAGVRLVDSQKCVRTNDIDEIGDNTHATFFEMLGNWSLGDYFKNEAIHWSFEFLTSKEEGLGLDPNRLYITVFGGNIDAPKDDETYAIWTKIFEDAEIKGERIYFMTADAKGKEPNWWSAGDSGPCGPDSEMFYDVTGTLNLGMTKEEYMAADDRQDVVEIWNDVFMEYLKEGGKVVGKLKKQNVDTGSGLERVTMVVQGKDNIFDTDLFEPLLSAIKESSTGNWDKKAARIIADHVRTAIFMIADGVVPSNTDQGYILRRLLRRAVGKANGLRLNLKSLSQLVSIVLQKYNGVYPELVLKKEHIEKIISEEETKFLQTLHSGSKELTKLVTHALLSPTVKKPITGQDLFKVFSTHGYPLENSIEEIETVILPALGNLSLSSQYFDKPQVVIDFSGEMKKHQAISRSGSEQKFKGGLADNSEATVRLHTAHHLLLRALQLVLGPDVHQRGSNITPERLRIDFACPQKMTDEQKEEVARIVNEKISEDLPVLKTEMSLEDAEKLGAEHEFGAKYPDRVTVYSVGPASATPENPKLSERFSIEFCGGPHVTHTGILGKFRILKEEASSQGVRRIKAVLE